MIHQIKISILFLIIFCALNSYAQKRNNLKLIGIGYDNIITTKNFLSDNSDFESISFVLACTFNWGFGYERLLGDRVVLGVNYNRYFPSKTGEVAYALNSYSNRPTVFFQPQQKPNQYFSYGDYESKGSSLGFESKYYFKPHDKDGANGFYLASSYQLSIINHGFVSAQYTDTTNSNKNLVNYSFDNTTTLLNRFGLKLGVSASSFISTDFFIGLYYTPTGNFDQLYLSPLTNRNVSFVMGWQVGIPF